MTLTLKLKPASEALAKSGGPLFAAAADNLQDV